MSQEIKKAEKQDLSLVVRAIGSDLEHTQVRMMPLQMQICFSTIGK